MSGNIKGVLKQGVIYSSVASHVQHFESSFEWTSLLSWEKRKLGDTSTLASDSKVSDIPSPPNKFTPQWVYKEA